VDVGRMRESGTDGVRVRVELIYASRNETQWVFLKRRSGRWLISDMESLRHLPVLIPYGTHIREVP